MFTFIYSVKPAHILLKALIHPNCIIIITKVIRSLDAFSCSQPGGISPGHISLKALPEINKIIARLSILIRNKSYLSGDDYITKL
jgi:hypothetical protein